MHKNDNTRRRVFADGYYLYVNMSAAGAAVVGGGGDGTGRALLHSHAVSSSSVVSSASASSASASSSSAASAAASAATAGRHCFRLSYYMAGDGADCCELRLYVVRGGDVGPLGGAVWRRDAATRLKWVEASVELTSDTPFKVGVKVVHNTA